MTVGLPAGTPVQWAGNHRFITPRRTPPLDPHSPLHRGFLRACGLVPSIDESERCASRTRLGGPARMLADAWMRPRTNQEHNALAGDVSADRWCRFISRPWPLCGCHALCTRRFRSGSRIDGGAGLVSREPGSRWSRSTILAMRSTASRTCSDASWRTQRDESRNSRVDGHTGAGRRLARESSSFSIQRKARPAARTVRLDVGSHPSPSRQLVSPTQVRVPGNQDVLTENPHRERRSNMQVRALRKGAVRPERSESVAGALSRHEPAAQRRSQGGAAGQCRIEVASVPAAA